ncbi:3'-5' exoribonuclease [Vibrio mimicus]
MESDASQELIDKYFNDGEYCTDWQPRAPSKSSFILSIHDTEGGPYVWWLQQSDEARSIYAKDTPKLTLKEALTQFNDWLAEQGESNDLYLWGNGKEFDNVIVRNAFEACRIKPNFSHWNDTDVRTIVKMGRDILGIDPKSTMSREGVHHSALDDAKFQAAYVSEIWKSFAKSSLS